eukprot:134744_1
MNIHYAALSRNFHHFLNKNAFSTVSKQLINCKIATQSIKNLYQNNDNKQSNSIIVSKAFEIYNQIDSNEVKNHFVINTMVKLCLSTKHPHKIWLIWNDINTILGSNKISYPSLIRCCIESNNFDKGTIIHSKIPWQLIDNDNYIQNALINFYSHFNQIQDAINLFESIPENNIINVNTISAMMKAYIKNKCEKQSLLLYQKYNQSVSMNDICHLFAIKSCINTNNFQSGDQIIKQLNINISNSNKYSIELLNSIINFYGHFGKTIKALDMFKQIDTKTAVTINSMMQAYINNNSYIDALSIYNDAKSKYVTDDVSHLLAVKACTNTNNMQLGEDIIDNTLSKTKNINYMNTVIHFYNHFKQVSKAEYVFNQIKNKTIKSVNAFMTAYYDNGLFTESIGIFRTWINAETKLKPDTMTYIIALKSYGDYNDISNGSA